MTNRQFAIAVGAIIAFGLAAWLLVSGPARAQVQIPATDVLMESGDTLQDDADGGYGGGGGGPTEELRSYYWPAGAFLPGESDTNPCALGWHVVSGPGAQLQAMVCDTAGGFYGQVKFDPGWKPASGLTFKLVWEAVLGVGRLMEVEINYQCYTLGDGASNAWGTTGTISVATLAAGLFNEGEVIYADATVVPQECAANDLLIWRAVTTANHTATAEPIFGMRLEYGWTAPTP